MAEAEKKTCQQPGCRLACVVGMRFCLNCLDRHRHGLRIRRLGQARDASIEERRRDRA